MAALVLGIVELMAKHTAPRRTGLVEMIRGLANPKSGGARWEVHSGDHDRCFSILVLGAFSTGVFNSNALPRINIGADVWGESSIMTGVY